MSSSEDAVTEVAEESNVEEVVDALSELLSLPFLLEDRFLFGVCKQSLAFYPSSTLNMTTIPT